MILILLEVTTDDLVSFCWSTPNQRPSQRGPKVLDAVHPEVSVCLAKNVAVGYYHVEQAPEYILVLLPAFETDVVVSPNLIVVVYSTHVSVV